MIKRTFQQGQSLIVLVLMIALVLAIVSAASYRLTTQIQSGVLQEGSVRALAAADTGIELGLKKANEARDVVQFETYTYEDLGIALEGIDAERSRVLVTNTGGNFVTPEISKDSQFTFYVQDPSDTAATAMTTPIIISLHSNTSDCGTALTPRTQAAYEITYIYGTRTDPNVKRDIVEPCAGGVHAVASASTITTLLPRGSYMVDSFTFEDRFTVDPTTLSNLRMIIIRPLFSSATFGFQGTTLPSQGKDIRAEAYTIGGPSKIVTVFQSLPQIPAEFFVTTF
ncbi:hypothetical protein KBD81_01690 [Candidatus Woesebacteria bacterium]|nr:hypothetical protein [Candidatus Woesebacteria bacterium]